MSLRELLASSNISDHGFMLTKFFFRTLIEYGPIFLVSPNLVSSLGQSLHLG